MNNDLYTATGGEMPHELLGQHEVHFGYIRVTTTYPQGGSVVHEFPKEYRLNLQQKKQILQILHGAEPMKHEKVKRLERKATHAELVKKREAEAKKREEDRAWRKKLLFEARLKELNESKHKGV